MDTKLSAIEQVINPFSVYARLRAEDPVYFDPRRGNWNVFRFEDVQRVLSDYETFSSQFAGSAASGDEPFAASLISTDPPRHRQLRSLVTQAFTPRAVDALAPRIRQIVDDHLDRAGKNGSMDVIHDLGYPLPTIVIAELLGIPTEDRERFKRWSDFAVSAANFGESMDYERFMGSEMMEMGMYFINMIEHRRETPGDDLITGLLNAEIEGEKLSQIELLGFCVLLLVAGNETTTNLIGNAMLTFAEQPELWARLRAEPALLSSAIEEILRYRSPVQSMFRVAKQDAVLQGMEIPAGSPMVAWIGSANHDETMFPDPEQVDLSRSPNKHLGFGTGIHYCLGAPLARLEARAALSAMLERYQSVRLADGAQLERLPSLIVYGLRAVPLALES